MTEEQTKPPKAVMIIVISIAAATVLFAIANGVYESKYHWLRYERTATCPSGRSGKVVNHCPFDLRVEVNVPATQAEIDAEAQERISRGGGWTEENAYEGLDHMRAWETHWRWNVDLKFRDVLEPTP